jgi:CRP-like cAMP-binding protein
MITGTISTLALVVMMGILSLIFTEKKETPVEIYDSICQNFSFFINKQVPKALKSRFKTFARFKSSVQHFYGEVRIKEIYKHLPENIVHKLIFEKSRCRLKKVPFLRDHYQEILFKRIALSLKAEIYLPGDYLIYKDDQGDEMYFIGIGVVNIISPDNSKIIKSLRNGDFVGEMALINNSPRICSVVANTLCLAFVLKKQDFDSILKSFPEVLETIRKYSEIRSRETTSIMKNPELKFVESRHPKQIISQLSMYSALASSFAVATQNQDKFSLITGMKNLKSCQDLDSFSVKDPGFNLFRRRPAKHETSKRRKSLEPLGKNLIFNKFLKI